MGLINVYYMQYVLILIWWSPIINDFICQCRHESYGNLIWRSPVFFTATNAQAPSAPMQGNVRELFDWEWSGDIPVRFSIYVPRNLHLKIMLQPWGWCVPSSLSKHNETNDDVWGRWAISCVPLTFLSIFLNVCLMQHTSEDVSTSTRKTVLLQITTWWAPPCP